MSSCIQTQTVFPPNSLSVHALLCRASLSCFGVGVPLPSAITCTIAGGDEFPMKVRTMGRGRGWHEGEERPLGHYAAA